MFGYFTGRSNSNAMQTELRAVLEETRALGEAHQWLDVTNGANSLLEEGVSRGIMVAAPAGVDAIPFLRWATEEAPEAEVNGMDLEGLGLDPMPAVRAGKAVAVFECGQLIEAEAMDAISNAFFGRPASSYAIVLTGAERVDNAEELGIVQRGVWRLLIPDPKPEWAGQDLLQHNCFLWSEGEPAEFFRRHVERDKSALARWLQAPPAEGDDLASSGALYVLDLAESHVRREEDNRASVGLPSAAVEFQRVSSALESLSETRRRLIRRLDADVSSLERQLLASLQTLEQDLHHHLPAHVRTGNGTVSDFIRGRVVQWQGEAGELVQKRGKDIAGEVKDLWGDVDWELINRLAAHEGDRRVYPDALMSPLQRDASFGPAAEDWVPPSPTNTAPVSDLPSLVPVAIGAALVVGISGLLLGAVGIIGGVVVVAVAAAVGVKKLRGAGEERRAEEQGHAAISEMMGRATTYVTNESRRLLAPARDELNKGLQAIEELLERALTEARQAQAREKDGITAQNSDLQLLDRLRQRLRDTKGSGMAPSLAPQAPLS